MSDDSISSLQTLPVEILHHILDGVDAHTILFSFRNTCRRFRAVVRNYNRYVLNLQSISKPNFDLVCHLIDPSDVTSLILSDGSETFDQINSFLSRFHLHHFNRLHSLSLFINEEERLKAIVERFKNHSLKSFSLKIDRSDNRRKTTTARFLSTIIAKAKLQKLDLNIQDGRFEKIVWPTDNSIEHLSINNFIVFDEICTILQRSPHLQTLVISSIVFLNSNEIVPTRFEHLRSLTMNQVGMKIDNLEFFLSMVPSLVHLKLIGTANSSNGNRWENFIKSHLSSLNRFEFFFTEIQTNQQNLADLREILLSFQTPFWLEDKKWFVACELDPDAPRCITLYSIPICINELSYRIGKTTISTYPESNNGNISIMDNVDILKLDFTKPLPLNMKKQENKTNYPLFRRVKRLELKFDTARCFGWIEIVTNLIDVKSIVHVTISSLLIRQSTPYILFEVAQFFQNIPCLSSVDLGFGFLTRKSSLTCSEICSMLPSHIKHLSASIKDLNEIKSIFQRLEHLSSANFFYDYMPAWNEVTQWLDDNRSGSSYEADSFSMCVWLGKINNSSKQTQFSNKRIKLVDEHRQS